MWNWIFGGSLAAVTATGVVFVLSGDSNRHCGPCVTPQVGATTATPSACCSTGQPACCGVVDVTDLPRAFAEPTEPTGPFVSFDEPPISKALLAVAPIGAAPYNPRPVMAVAGSVVNPNLGVVTVGFEEPTAMLEEAPMPRMLSVVEVAPMPRMVE